RARNDKSALIFGELSVPFTHRLLGAAAILPAVLALSLFHTDSPPRRADGTVTVRNAVAQDVSPPLAALACAPPEGEDERNWRPVAVSWNGSPVRPAQKPPLTSAAVEQTTQGTKAAPQLVASFDGLGHGFQGPQGTAVLRNPSDNSLAVGPDHIVQIVNTRMAVFTKKGAKYETTGKVLYGPVNTGNVFKGFGDFGDL